ncbi:FUSC family protein [Methylobacterium phyllosphaerae]
MGLDALGLALRNENTGSERAAEAFAPLRQHMLMVLPIVAAVSSRVATLERAGALPPRVRAFLSDLAVWLAEADDDPAGAARLRSRIDGFAPVLGRNPDWPTLLLASLAERLRDVVDLRQDLRALRDHVAAGTAPRAPLAFAYTARVRSIRHRDHGLAAFSAFGVFVGLLVCCAIWIATGWPDGAAAPMMGAVACCLFAAQDDPAPQILSFANSAIVGALGAGFYLFAVLPLATSFEMVALALAPALILCGVMMTQPRFAAMGMGAALNGATLLALQNGYNGEFAPFANGVVASVVGMWSAAVVTRLIRSVGAGWSARRLVRINRRSLAAAADGRGTGHGLELAALMLDRVGLIAPRLATLPAETSAGLGDLLADVRVGINLVAVRRVRRSLTGTARTAVDHVLALAARAFRGRTGRLETGLLVALDDALDAVAASGASPERRAALIGLTGLRHGLYPDAPAYRAATAPHLREMAA